MSLLRGRGRHAVVALFATAASLTTAAPPAAANGPFACPVSTIFVAQRVPTQLQALVYAAGESTFKPIGTPVSNYNAIGFHPVDNFIYGVDVNGRYIRISNTGALSVVLAAPGFPSSSNVGAFDASGSLYVTQTDLRSMYILAPGASKTTTRSLSAATGVADWTFIGGKLWGQDIESSALVRVDPVTGVVERFTTSFIPATVFAGAAWTYGSGNLGLSDNETGTIYQIKIGDPAGPSPQLSLIAKSPGPKSSHNDGTSCQGQPADLSIAKSAPEQVEADVPITWTLTVTNGGPGHSSGYVVTDEIPAGVTNISSPTVGCTVTSRTVTCVGEQLAPGASHTITITGVPTQPGTLVNTASVTPNDADPDPANNAATSSTRVVRVVFTCQATALRLGETATRGSANSTETPCATAQDEQLGHEVIPPPDLGGPLQATEPVLGVRALGAYTSFASRRAHAAARVERLRVAVPGTVIELDAAESDASVLAERACDSATAESGSRVGALTVNGSPTPAGDAPMTIPLGEGAIHLNQTIRSGSTLAQRAAFIDLPGTADDVTIAESRAGAVCD